MVNSSESNHPERDNRVLILAPTRRDGDVTIRLLASVGIPCTLCCSSDALVTEIGSGAGAVLLTEKVAHTTKANALVKALSEQAPWSDLPIVMLVAPGAYAITKAFLASLSNVTVLERPTTPYNLISTVQAALRARARQYQIRELLEKEAAARAESDRTNRIKDEFLATLSHELRTPLNAIFGWTHILKMKPSDSGLVAQAIEVIDRNMRVQTQLIEDLLDMSRIISGKIRLEVQDISLADVIDAALGSVTPAVLAKEICLEKVVNRLECTICGDFGRLQQVFWNLLTNAVKFTPQGGRIHILCDRVEAHVEVTITDTGEGIAPEFLPHLFERFSQADGSSTRQHGGLGLGLSIVKYLVELHGGSIRAASPGRGEGATFQVRLPLPSAKIQENQAPPLAQNISDTAHLNKFHKLQGLKILVVDDEPDGREVVRRFLDAYQAVTKLAASARQAEEILEVFSPDVIISDIGMPGEDGISFIKRVRSSGSTIPAIALTAFARADDRSRCLQAGFQSHLPKPVAPDDLLNLIIQLHEH